jgi:alpha-L-fucosidase
MFLITFLITLLACAGGSFVAIASSAPEGQPGREIRLAPLHGVTRILFLGDSITYAGGYVEILDAYLYRHAPSQHYELINVGLPSETVSGLTEPNHAGGAFPRPDLHERLERALTQVRPDLVVACYGMNDGIYYPPNADRFQKYQEGIRKLQARVRQAGAKLWLLTPPPFDPLPIRKDTLPKGKAEYPSGHPYAGYDDTLTQYSTWLLSQRKSGWHVTDIHGPINAHLREQRQTQPDFALSGDGVHINPLGHRLIAREILRAWGAPANTLPTLETAPSDGNAQDETITRFLKLVNQRQRLLTDAWLTDIGHKRPGMAQGVPLPLAQTQAKELDTQIRALLSGRPAMPTTNNTNSLNTTPADAQKVSPLAPYGAVPSDRQLRWHEMEMYAFLHFTTNTFTDKEWGYGDEDTHIFHPTAFDADQIILALKAAGMKGAILTCKHHDGFCLWPTKTTEHSVAHSGWKEGKGDAVREISDACKRHGLKFGVYLSPWDRNSALYGKAEYVGLYRAQLRELLTDYGPIFEVWHDGANGGDGYYGGARETRSIDRRTYYDWPQTWNLVRELQPHAAIFSDVGPDVRWVGNESGVAGETCWATLVPVGTDGGEAAPGYVREQELGTGHRNAPRWLPAECDVSIRPGWFWHEAEDDRVKTPAQLLDLYYKSVGRGANFLLNVPPDRRGQLHSNDVAALKTFGERVHATFQTNLARHAKLTASNIRGGSAQFTPQNLLDSDHYTCWSTDDGVTTPTLIVDMGKETRFNVIRLRENIKLGQRVETFALDCWKDGDWQEFAHATSIGACRLIRLPQSITTSKVRLRITQCPVSPALSDFGLFAEPQEDTRK